jgi:hypothetical protein
MTYSSSLSSGWLKWAGKLSTEDASSLIAEDFIEFGASGKVWTKAEIIAAMTAVTRRQHQLPK